MTDSETGHAVVIGASGGIGSALVAELEAQGWTVTALSRRTSPPLDLLDEASIHAAAQALKEGGDTIRLIIDATGFLHDDVFSPERSLRELDPDHFARAFALNATGPALLMKHFLPLLPRQGRSVFATLSARVGSISDNRLGGWHAYRASKAALNQILRSVSIEMKRRKPEAICIALHPGTVATRLSEPFSKSGLDVRPPQEAAQDLLRVIAGLGPDDSGGFRDHKGMAISF
ncbi:SDR family NAD(P)-dependent oxidoreductase [Maricaulis parjimensis]|uniref:SDR family NAD(P)-dependent oxidoreductase n=1 Tax=Maricaulis parjimensis TaxID=144023 RepID=UPI00193A1116|nr:SDR family NAD(P)-dependent oxidoreductase [Maricaulis parjimensis]